MHFQSTAIAAFAALCGECGVLLDAGFCICLVHILIVHCSTATHVYAAPVETRVIDGVTTLVTNYNSEGLWLFGYSRAPGNTEYPAVSTVITDGSNIPIDVEWDPVTPVPSTVTQGTSTWLEYPQITTTFEKTFTTANAAGATMTVTDTFVLAQ